MQKISQCHKDMMLGLGENVSMYILKYFYPPLLDILFVSRKEINDFQSLVISSTISSI